MKDSERKLIESRAYSRGYAAGKKAILLEQKWVMKPLTPDISHSANSIEQSARIVPKTLLSMEVQFKAAQHMLDGLMDHYLDAVCSGRTEKWIATGKSVIELLASPAITLHRRDSIQASIGGAHD
jgi:hypothetical protein